MILTMPYTSIDNASTKIKYSIENTYHYVTDLQSQTFVYKTSVNDDL